MSQLQRSLTALLLAVSPAVAFAQFPLRDAIDQQIAAKWQEQGITPVGPSSDEVFLRRVYLDLCGTIPTADEARAFLDDAANDKRPKLIKRLLADPRYGQQQAEFWDMIYFGRNPPGYDADKRRGFQRWLREEFNRNTPYDKIANTMLKAEGNTAEHGAPMFLVQYDRHPEDATVKITQTFLGVQLQCARCHDHPYETWTQLDFYGMAAFLARLERVELGDKDGEKRIAIGEKSRGEINFVGPAKELEPGKKGEPVPAKFLLGDTLAEPEQPKDAKEERFEGGKAPPKPQFSRKDSLADWITKRDNPYFARALANRVWAQYMGRGLVHPVDNMSESNKPTHPELLDELTKQLIDHDFDLKWFIEELANSKTYQLASTGSVEAERPMWFERGRVRPLSAEELADAWRTAVNYAAIDPKTSEQLAKGERFFPLGEYQKNFLGDPTDGVGNFLGGMHEHLYMTNGGIDRLFDSRQGGLMHTLAEARKDAPLEERIELMYLSILSRRPRPEETQKIVEYMSTAENKDRLHEPFREAMWVLMTCSEFRFNH
jgi:hypothetical protein